MIESMQKRGSPVNAHKVATRYFDSFRKERNIPASAEWELPHKETPAAVSSRDSSAVTTAVESVENKKTPEKKTTRKLEKKSAGQVEMGQTLSPSELKIYNAMLKFCSEKSTDSYRFGLKTLKELTGLSDKTVRKSIHALENKLCIKVLEPSLGIYGRKIRVLEPMDALQQRIRAGVEIDHTTKMVIERKGLDRSEGTAVSNMVSNVKGTAVITAQHTPVDRSVITSVLQGEEKDDTNKKEIEGIYEKYTGNKWGKRDEEYYRQIKNVSPELLETSIILFLLKGEGDVESLLDIKDVMRELGDKVSEGYLTELRKVWKKLNP